MNNEKLTKKLDTYKQAYQRSKKICLASERLLEDKTRELYNANQALKKQYVILERRAEELELFLSLAKFAQRKVTIEKALQFYVDAVCKLTRWPVGHVYAPMKGNNALLKPLNIWYFDDKSTYKKLYKTTNSPDFKINEDVPGRVFQTGEVLFIDDISTTPFYMRSKVCQELKLRSTLGIPIKCYGKPLAMVEFFIPDTYAHDLQMHNLVFSFTSQLETLLEKLKSEEEARENHLKLQKALKDVKKLAYYDPVTGLANRRQFEISLKQEIARAQRHHHKFALLYLDVDYFKSVNDSFGHDIGDLLLKEIAIRLKKSVRAGDVVARMGGDEFAILLEQLKTAKSAEKVAKQILKSVSEPCKLNHHEVFINLSIGIACYPSGGKDFISLYKNADIAMYNAKKAGRNGYEFFKI